MPRALSRAAHLGAGRAGAHRVPGRRDCDARARGSPLFTHMLFPIYVALLLWGGLYLREERLRELVPFRR